MARAEEIWDEDEPYGFAIDAALKRLRAAMTEATRDSSSRSDAEFFRELGVSFPLFPPGSQAERIPQAAKLLLAAQREAASPLAHLITLKGPLLNMTARAIDLLRREQDGGFCDLDLDPQSLERTRQRVVRQLAALDAVQAAFGNWTGEDDFGQTELFAKTARRRRTLLGRTASVLRGEGADAMSYEDCAKLLLGNSKEVERVRKAVERLKDNAEANQLAMRRAREHTRSILHGLDEDLKVVPEVAELLDIVEDKAKWEADWREQTPSAPVTLPKKKARKSKR